MEGYDIVTAKEDDKERIAEFLRQSFYTREPLNVSTGSDPNRPISAILPLRVLSEGKSLLAVSRNGRHIVGVCLNRELKRNENAYSIEQSRLTGSNYSKIANFVQEFQARADIWSKLDGPRAILIDMLGVEPASVGQGIGRALMETTRDKAQSDGYHSICILCSSHFSAQIARNMGMECVYSLPYSEYKDEDGNVVFKPPHPHTEMAVFVQKLSTQT
jgi:GNAT superfamily N-acetyltransferase